MKKQNLCFQCFPSLMERADINHRCSMRRCHLRGSYGGCRTTEEEHQAAVRGACAEGKSKLIKAGEEAGMREEGWAGILGRGRGRGEDTEARQSRAGWGPCQWLCREGPDQEESGFYPEAGE